LRAARASRCSFLESKDAAGDAETFSGAHIGDPDALRFEREAKRPDGSSVKVGFSLAFAEDKDARDIHFAACQQHYPENFWNPNFQQHPNGVSAVAGVVAVAEQPEQHRRFFEVFADSHASAGSDGFAIATPRGTIDVLTPAAFLRRFGVKAPDMSRGARLAALRFAVTSPSRPAGVARTRRHRRTLCRQRCDYRIGRRDGGGPCVRASNAEARLTNCLPPFMVRRARA
jgi:hypothetical protein